jgi:hypothetical protein
LTWDEGETNGQRWISNGHVHSQRKANLWSLLGTLGDL